MNKMACLFPGSFDPVTNGHMDLIRRAARLFDRVYVGVLHNPDKKGCFTVEERVGLLKACCSDLANVEVVSFAGLTVDLCRELNVHVLLRGVRNFQDLEMEKSLHAVNRMLDERIETVFLPANPGMEDVSSSVVRQLASFRGEADLFLPAPAAKAVREKFCKHS